MFRFLHPCSWGVLISSFLVKLVSDAVSITPDSQNKLQDTFFFIFSKSLGKIRIWVIYIYFLINLFFFGSYIEMKRPWVYMSSPSRSPLPPPSPPAPSRSSQSTRSERLSHASNLGWWSVSRLIVYMFRCCSLETSHPRLLPQSLNDCSINL